MPSEEQDDLWELLGRAKQPPVSPFFARNVLRAVRAETQEPAGFLAWLKIRWRFAAIGAGAFALLLVTVVPREEHTDQLSLLASQVSASPDYQVISHLDELLDSEKNSVWLENPTY